MQKNIKIKLSWQAILFFVILETITVPMVAMANNFAHKGIIYLAFFGFVIAMIALFILLRSLEHYFIKNSEKIFSLKIVKVNNLWLIPIIAGVLEMVMFLVQGELFGRGYRDYSAGFWSALISVFVSLVIYKLLLDIFACSLQFIANNGKSYMMKVSWWNILLASILFGLYEMIVCPITGWWIPYQGVARFGMAVLSGVVGGFLGAALLVAINQFIPSSRFEILCDDK